MSDGESTEGITIGQAASYAGVIVKTVRRYHRCGLIDEPRRDGSGYRRYASSDLLRLVQVRTSAAAGVPPAEIKTLLDADTEQFAAALVDKASSAFQTRPDTATRYELVNRHKENRAHTRLTALVEVRLRGARGRGGTRPRFGQTLVRTTSRWVARVIAT